jgi:hypothetical protein
MELPLRAALAALMTLSLVACNGSGSSSINPFVPSRGTVRFINGSPDVGSVDVAVGTPNVPNFRALPYAGSAQNAATNSNPGISQYTQFNSSTQNIFVYNAGTAQRISVPQSSINIVSRGRVTVVLTGSVAKGNLRLVSFTEHLFTTILGSASVAFHHASQQFVTTHFTVGNQPAPAGTGTVCASGFAVIPPALAFGVSPPTFQEGLPSYAQSGIGFCAQSGATILTLLPSNLNAGNSGNVMPFTGAGAVNSDQNLSIYLIDGPSGSNQPALVGVFDPNN